MSSLSVTRTVGRKKRAQAAPRRHFAFLPRFDYRRPFDSLWALFCSLRTAIVLIATLAVIGVAGMLIPQAPEEVVSSPQDYAGWVAANMQPQFHSLTDFMNWLQLFTIFNSWYFKALVALLAINILVCSVLNRAPTIWHKFRHPQLKRADGFYANSPVKVGLTVGEESDTTQTVTAGMRRFFTKRGYRVETAPGSSDQVTYLYVHKHAWSALSTLVFHIGMIGVMFSAVLTGWGGFGNNSMASRILPRPIYNYFQSLAGFSYDQPLPNGAQGVVYPLGTDHNIFYRAQNFVAVMDPVRKQPTDFYTDLQLFQDGKLVASKRIRVNDPLTYQGVTFHQASFMMYTDISLRDDKGNVLYSSQVPLLDQRTTQPDPNTGNVFTSNNAENVPIATYGEFMNIAAINVSGQWLIIAKGFNQNNQEIFQGGGIFGQGCIDANLQPAATGTYGCQLTNGWWLKINDVRMGTVLLITKDSGSPLLWPVLAMMLIGLWVTFSFPPRRIWARIEGDQVRMATLKEHYINMQRELDTFARALGNRPLRPAADAEIAANGHNGKKDAAAKKHATPAKKRDAGVASPV